MDPGRWLVRRIRRSPVINSCCHARDQHIVDNSSKEKKLDRGESVVVVGRQVQ